MIPFGNTLLASYFELEILGNTFSLLPFGHSRNFPLSFSLSPKKVISGEPNFFNGVLYKNFEADNFISPHVCDLEFNSQHEALVILNVLDNCFGHALLKLFYAMSYMEQNKHQYDFLVIVPKALKHFLMPVPDITCNVLCINLSFSKLEGCYILNQQVDRFTHNYKSVFLQGTETYAAFDIPLLRERLNLFNGNNSETKKDKIIFYYRADYFRKWAGNAQAKHVTRLFSFLKGFFDEEIKFYVLGDKDAFKFPAWIKDERASGFSPELDFKYNVLFSSALICIGLTGSHMLFPSMLSGSTVHLHPSYKYKNMAEDIVVNEHSHEMLSAYRHLYYYGNYNCSNLKPSVLGTLILFQYQGLAEKIYKIENNEAISQQYWMRTRYSFLRLDKVNSYRSRLLASENKKNKYNYYLDKLFSFLK